MHDTLRKLWLLSCERIMPILLILLIMQCDLSDENRHPMYGLEKREYCMARMSPDGGKEIRTKTTQDAMTNLWRQLKANTAIILYALLALGLVLLLTVPALGGAIIGFIGGYVFSDEITRYAISLKNTIEHEEVLRGVILGVVLIAFIIEAPSIVISAAIAIAVRRLIVQKR